MKGIWSEGLAQAPGAGIHTLGPNENRSGSVLQWDTNYCSLIYIMWHALEGHDRGQSNASGSIRIVIQTDGLLSRVRIELKAIWTEGLAPFLQLIFHFLTACQWPMAWGPSYCRRRALHYCRPGIYCSLMLHSTDKALGTVLGEQDVIKVMWTEGLPPLLHAKGSPQLRLQWSLWFLLLLNISDIT